jgi:hypothetical protein
MNDMLIIAKKRLNLINLRVGMYPAEGPRAQDTGSSILTHGELLEVVDHS